MPNTPEDTAPQKMNECEDLISLLSNPREEFWAETQLMSRGKLCAEELRAFISTPPLANYTPWIRAIDILTRTAPREAEELFSFLLLREWRTPDNSMSRMAEETVKNHMALALAGLSPKDSTDILAEALYRFRLIGAAQALVQLGDYRAITVLLEMLEDDTLRDKAAEALLYYGDGAIPHLMASLETKREKDGEAETPSSILRRKATLEILGRVPGKESLPPLIKTLEDPELSVYAAIVLANRGYPQGQLDKLVVDRLLEGLCGEDWFVSMGCRDALMELEGVMDLLVGKIPIMEPGCIKEVTRLLARQNPKLAEEKLSALLESMGADLPSELINAIAEAPEFSDIFKEIATSYLE